MVAVWQPAVYSPEMCQLVLSGDKMCGMCIFDSFPLSLSLDFPGKEHVLWHL